MISLGQPDIIYTHSIADSHQDHRATAEASMSARRRVSRLCAYESPTTTSFTPTLFVDVASTMETKLTALRAHTSQVLKNGLVDLEAIEAQARYRGFQARIRHAEGFEPSRFVMNIGDHESIRANNASSAQQSSNQEEILT